MTISIVCSIMGLLCGAVQTEQFAVAPNWYQWADQRNSPARYAPAEMSRYDMSTRCLCAKGFIATKASETTFTIISAPKGYADTVGKEFISKPVPCLICAD